jgi:hypothetical protein
MIVLPQVVEEFISSSENGEDHNQIEESDKGAVNALNTRPTLSQTL